MRLPRRSLHTGEVVHRMFRRLGPDHRPRGPWYFSSSGTADSGRFDLPAPSGTCYFATSAVGAWLEVFGNVALVDAADVRRRSLAHATRSGAALPLVDLASPRAASLGISLDVVSGSDYATSQSLAHQAFSEGADGVRALLRRDPSGTSHNIALFGRAGAPSRQFGWRVVRSDPWRSAELLTTLASIGVHVAEVPHDLPVTPPPTHPPPPPLRRS
jgi:hypothetical protein